MTVTSSTMSTNDPLTLPYIKDRLRKSNRGEITAKEIKTFHNFLQTETSPRASYYSGKIALLGLDHPTCKFTLENETVAHCYFEIGAAKKDTVSMRALATLLLKSNLACERGQALLEEAAKLGDNKAYIKLAFLKLEQAEIKCENNNPIKLKEKIVSALDQSQCLATERMHKTRITKASDYLKTAAQQNCAEAYYLLAVTGLFKAATEDNFNSYDRCLINAADLGHLKAIRQLLLSLSIQKETKCKYIDLLAASKDPSDILEAAKFLNNEHKEEYRKKIKNLCLKYLDAVKDLESAQVDIKAHRILIKIYCSSSKETKAAEHYMKIYELTQKAEDLLNYLTFCLDHSLNITNNISEFELEKIKQLQGSEKEWSIALAYYYHNCERNLHSALPYYSLASKYEHPLGNYVRGTLYFSGEGPLPRDLCKAIACFTATIRRANDYQFRDFLPQFQDALVKLGKIYEELGLHVEAEKYNSKSKDLTLEWDYSRGRVHEDISSMMCSQPLEVASTSTPVLRRYPTDYTGNEPMPLPRPRSTLRASLPAVLNQIKTQLGKSKPLTRDIEEIRQILFIFSQTHPYALYLLGKLTLRDDDQTLAAELSIEKEALAQNYFELGALRDDAASKRAYGQIRAALSINMFSTDYYLKEAAKLGDKKANLILAKKEMDRYRECGDLNYQKRNAHLRNAINYYVKAALEGSAEAFYQLGVMGRRYENLTTSPFNNSFVCLKIAADWGHIKAMDVLLRRHRSELQDDCEKKYFNCLVEAGVLDFLYEAITMELENNNTEQAMIYCQSYVNNAERLGLDKLTNSQVKILAKLYEKGMGCEQNLSEASKLYLMICKNKGLLSFNVFDDNSYDPLVKYLAFCAKYALPIEANTLEWQIISRIANQAYRGEKNYAIALAYYHHQKMQNLEAALPFYALASQQNNPLAHYERGILYSTENSFLPRNLPRAILCFESAIAHGEKHPFAKLTDAHKRLEAALRELAAEQEAAHSSNEAV